MIPLLLVAVIGWTLGGFEGMLTTLFIAAIVWPKECR